MPDLLLELFSEEIPARMQRQAAEDLKRLVTAALVERNLAYEGAQAFVTPRRLALHVVGLPGAQPDLREERRGPRVGAPEAAIQGFLKSARLARIEDARIEKDPKKGEFYVAVIEKPGRTTSEALAEIIPSIVKTFPWPKSMRWGAASTKPDALRWVRPLRGLICTLATQHESVEIVPFEVDGLRSGDVTFGHRFMEPGPISVRRYEDYADALQKAKVVLDADRRKAIILADATSLAFAQGLELVEDEGLLEEVAGLVEWPVALIGEFELGYLDIPPEVIRATIRANQKCFVLRDATGRLANRFILVSNLVASDGGAAIAAGNASVVRARLADARHFWLTDLHDLHDYGDKTKKPLDQRLAKLEALGIVFHEKLGTQAERIDRIEALTREIAPKVGADVELAARAARLAKADLVTEMVGEFPELQGLMGRYYAHGPGRGGERRRGDRGALQAAGAERPDTDFAGVGRGRPRRQARHARGLLGDRREADRQQGPLCTAARRTRGHPRRARKRAEAPAHRAARRSRVGRPARCRVRPRGRGGLRRPVAREARFPQRAGARGDRRCGVPGGPPGRASGRRPAQGGHRKTSSPSSPIG